MSIKENKDLVYRYCMENADEIRSRIAGNDEFHDPAFIIHDHRGDSNLKQQNQFVSALVDAFPDIKYNAEDVIAEGDKVACKYSWTGTQKGVFQGIPPTGKKIKLEGILIAKIAGGRLPLKSLPEREALLIPNTENKRPVPAISYLTPNLFLKTISEISFLCLASGCSFG